MAMNGIMDFVQRFQELQLHRDTADELVKVRSTPPDIQAYIYLSDPLVSRISWSTPKPPSLHFAPTINT